MCAQPAIFFLERKLNKTEQNLNKTWVVLELQYYQ